MSHVCEIDLEIKDIDALGTAAKKLGLELRKDQGTYRWYGTHVGDYPLPAGFTVEDMGRCEHALSIPGNDGAYEVGIVKRRDGKPGWTLLWDFYAGGYGLQALIGEDPNTVRDGKKIGANANKLCQRYAAEVSIKVARKKGLRVTEKMENGRLRLVCQR